MVEEKRFFKKNVSFCWNLKEKYYFCQQTKQHMKTFNRTYFYFFFYFSNKVKRDVAHIKII